MNSTILLVGSAFLHALWNAFAKKSSNPAISVWGILTFAALFSVVFFPFFDGPSFANRQALSWGLGAGVFEAGYMVTLGITLTRSTLGASYTIMRGGAMLVVWILSALFLHEKINFIILSGILLVTAGLYLTANPRKNSKASARITPWVYACALCIAGYHLCYGRSLEQGANPASLFSLSLWISIPALFVYYGKKGRSLLRGQVLESPWRMIFAGFLSAASFTLFLVGLKSAGAGFALTLRNTSVVFAQILLWRSASFRRLPNGSERCSFCWVPASLMWAPID